MTVEPDDIARTLEQEAPSDSSPTFKAWTQWIADARTQIRVRLGDLERLDEEVLDYVVREAVAEKVRNPQGVKQSSVTIDDGTISKTYQGGTGQVTIRDEWWALLTPTPVDDRGAFTIRPGGNPPRRVC